VRAGLLWLLALAALVAVVAVGLHEARTDRPRESTAGPPGTAEIRS
jgi:hypothetical protein